MINEAKHSGVVAATPDAKASLALTSRSIFDPTSDLAIEIHEDVLPLSQVSLPAIPKGSDLDGLLVDLVSESRLRAERLRSPTVWNQAGTSYLAVGDLQSAREAFGNALELDPGNRSARLGLARTAHQGGASEEALRLLESVQSDDPADVRVTVYMALVAAGTGQFQDALARLRDVVPDPKVAGTVFGVRGGIRVALGDFNGAVSDLRKAVRLKPDWASARNALGLAHLRLGRRRSAEEHFRIAARIDPVGLRSTLNLLGLFKTEGRWSDVVATIERRWAPETAPLAIARFAGEACLEVEDFRAARIWYGACLRTAVEPEDRAEILNNSGVAAYHLNRLSEAARYFEDSISALPSEIAITNRANLFLDHGMPERSIEWLSEHAGSVNPASRRVRHTLAVALHHLRRHSEAVALAEDLPRGPDAKEDDFMLLSVLYADGIQDRAAAIKTALEGLERWPSSASLVNNLCYALLLDGQVERAAAYLNAVDWSNCTREQRTYLQATRGLLSLREGDIGQGRKLYDSAAGLAGRETLRARVRAKRDLETARALMVKGAPTKEVIRYLNKVIESGGVAEPFTTHAIQERQLLSGGAGECLD